MTPTNEDFAEWRESRTTKFVIKELMEMSTRLLGKNRVFETADDMVIQNAFIQGQLRALSEVDDIICRGKGGED
jgi:hypothetical protein